MNIEQQMKKAQSLPLDKGEEWVMERRTLNIPAEELEEDVEPDVLVCLSAKTELSLGTLLTMPETSEEEMLSWALKCMTSPMVGKAYRPSKITLAGGRLDHLKEPLEELGISVTLSSKPSRVADELISLLEHDLSTPGVPPYTLDTNVDPDTAGDFFDAAAEFYKSKPWKLFDFEMPIKVELKLKKKSEYWVIAFGAGGEEFGLSMYNSFDDLMELLEVEDEEEATIVSKHHRFTGFSFYDVDDIGSFAQVECMANEWVLAGESAYPSAVVMDPKTEELIRRPNKNELQELTAATRAITAFLKVHKKQIKQMEYDETITDTMHVQAGGKDVPVTVTLPAPEFLEEIEEEEDAFLISEDMLRRPETPLDRAQELAYEAWEEESKNKRVKLAKRALAISEDCADAYLILAEDTARDKEEKLKLLNQAVEAGKRAIGEKDFKELTGNFWLALETRPYMRARLGLANYKMEIGDLEGALQDYQDMLRLSPNDNVGARYPLFNCLLMAGRDDELQKLLKKYEEPTAFWHYTNTLVNFRKSGASKKTNLALAKAVAHNQHVLAYLLGRKRIPKYMPENLVLRSDDEAVFYAKEFMDAWKSTEGALEWLEGYFGDNKI